MEDLVVKTMLLNLKEVREEFNAMSKSMYNTYKLLGFDVLVQVECQSNNKSEFTSKYSGILLK